MTIGGWVIFIAIAITLGFVFFALEFEEGKSIVIYLLITAILLFGVYKGMTWWYSSTESGKRAMKTQESNFEGGIRRNIKVYDAIGNMLQEFEGTFDVDFNADDRRVLFDDENGKRHLIYFNSGTVIVEEK